MKNTIVVHSKEFIQVSDENGDVTVWKRFFDHFLRDPKDRRHPLSMSAKLSRKVDDALHERGDKIIPYGEGDLMEILPPEEKKAPLPPTLSAKYIESIVPAQGRLLLNGWRVHTIIDEGRILLGSDRPEDIAERHSMGWSLELDCAEGLTDDARLVSKRTNGFINLDNFEWMNLVSATSIKTIVEFWGANIPRIKDTEWNLNGEICPNPICGGLCRKGHHYKRNGVRECFMHLCRHYPMEKNDA